MGLTHPVDNSKSKEQEALKIGSLKMAFWQGRDVDSFLKIARTAISLSKKGDYLRAKPAFMESLEGLEALLEPYSMQTISILEAFVKAAVDAKDFGTAIERLHKSNNDHVESLGNNDKRTWRSLARLGPCTRNKRVSALPLPCYSTQGRAYWQLPALIQRQHITRLR